jgi:large subunit ribosomal protein L31e
MSDQEEIQRVYTVPLSRAWITARHRRTRRAVHILREFAEHHMKSSEIKIDTDLNEELWKRGITKPPRRITVKMEKDEDGVVTISLPKETKKKEEEVLPSPSAPTTTGAQPAPSAPAAAAPSATPAASSSDSSQNAAPTKRKARKPKQDS